MVVLVRIQVLAHVQQAGMALHAAHVNYCDQIYLNGK